MSFQTTVLYVAIVIFIVLMLIVGAMMSSAKKNQIFPPQIGECPDYWTKLSPESGGACYNKQSLGKDCQPTVKNFEKSTMKEKCDFAKQCKITWDGITNAENDNGGPKYC